MGAAICPHDPGPQPGELTTELETPGDKSEKPTLEDATPVSEAAPPVSSASVSSARPEIKSHMIGPPADLLGDSLPEWRFELERDKWKAYSIEDSRQIDRYWRVYEDARLAGEMGDGAPHFAKIQVMRKETLIDFAAMTGTVGDGRPRKLQRELKHAGWLSNMYFFNAFKAALRAAGVDVESQPEDLFDFRYNQDFRGMQDDGRKLIRGGKPYTLPIGWMRFAVHVFGQYDDNKWLRDDETGWAVAYHGTAGESLPGILSSGFRVGDRQKFAKETGAGVYCTQWIDVAQHYSKPQLLEDHYVQIVLQLRVKPDAIKEITDPKATDFERKYWVINNPEHIRAYGVLIRELSLQEYVPATAMVFGFDHPAVVEEIRQIRAGK